MRCKKKEKKKAAVKKGMGEKEGRTELRQCRKEDKKGRKTERQKYV